MGKRQSCDICFRPMTTCICKHVKPVENVVSLIILQHPLEANEAKNSAHLLSLCLKNSQIIIGEQFNESVFRKIQTPAGYNVLLYPNMVEEKSMGLIQAGTLDLDRLIEEKSIYNNVIRLWVLDATWRKSRKMLYLNPALQAMPRLSLHDCPPSIYKIRKAHRENQLSTLEASCYALQQLERYAVDYSPVFEAFSSFVAEQQTFLSSL